MKYVCQICGYVYDEEKEGRPLSTLECCPLCKQPISNFQAVNDEKSSDYSALIFSDAAEPNLVQTEESYPEEVKPAPAAAYDKELVRHDPTARYMEEIHEMAVNGESLHAAMGTLLPLPAWEDILLLGAQLDPPPLDDDAAVSTRTIIGKKARKPMILETPVYISHMSFGALSREAKISLSKGSAMARTAMCSGEGGILSEEKEAAYRYIFEYIKVGEDIQSPSRFPEITNKDDLRAMVTMLRERSKGRPVGIKISAGNIEKDLEYCVYAEPDFITIDGRGGATGSSPLFLRDASSVPTIYALSRARKYLDSVHSDIDLVITGGLRISADIAKALAMGADAVAVASAPLIAAGCQQYRICGSGYCPVGIATQNPMLRKRLNVDEAAARVGNYLILTTQELKMFARISGVADIHGLGIGNLITTDESIAKYTGIRHAGSV